MNIVIVGAGTVGGTLAAKLALENNDLTVIDTDVLALQRLQDRLDIGTVHGYGSQPDVLAQAGAEFADMLIAVTQNDEVNIVACQIAHLLFRIPTKVARVRKSGYFEYASLFDREQPNALAIDQLIKPEALITDYIYHLVEHPGALQVEDFAAGKVRLVVLKAKAGGLMVRHKVKDLSHHLPDGMDARIAAIYRQGKPIIPSGDSEILAGDEVFIIAEPHVIEALLTEFGRMDQPYRNIMIAGGGHIGHQLSQRLEQNHQVKIVDRNLSQARYLAENLEQAIIIHGDVTDSELLQEENIDEIDLFIAITDSDEANAIASTMAKHHGVHKAIALLNKNIYADILHSANIDIAFSANQITASSILNYVRQGDTVKVHSLRRGAAEALEVVVHGSENSSKIIGCALEDIDWPPGIAIGCIVREGEVMIARRGLVLEAEDHMIVFVTDRDSLPIIAELCSPSSTSKKVRHWF